MKIHILKQTMAEYRLWPQVVLQGKPTEFTIRGLGVETQLNAGEHYRIRVIPQEEIGTAKTLVIGDTECYDELTVSADNEGFLHFTYTLPREEIYTFRLLNSAGERLGDLKLFSAKEDLWCRIPMRGNTHCHACHSVDGHEDPVVAASVYRKAGFDYLAITDHHKIDGSLFALEHIHGIPTEMALYPGEEVHVPNAYIHAVNVGAVLEGNVGLDRWYHDHEEEVNRQVQAIASEAAPNLPEDIEPLDFAWRKWIADTIHSQGGIAIIAHPFWEYDAHNTRNSMVKFLAETKLFDAMEVIHGQDDPDTTEANRQIAFWQDMRAEGIHITPVGCDDAHCRSFAWNYECNFNRAYTIVFAKDSSFQGFREAIQNGYSVAVESYGDAPEHVVGTYRLTRFALFLLEQYFPLHDELCFEEGRSMKEAYLGDPQALALLNLIHGRVRQYTDRFFGR